MKGVIKAQIESQRTKFKEMIPKFFGFRKLMFVAILSGTIWFLYFIGAAIDIAQSFFVMIKKEMKGKKDVRVDNMEDK